MVASTGVKVGSPSTRAGLALVDTDIHERPVSVEELVPYLAEPFRRYITHTGWLPNFPRPHGQVNVAGVDRADAKTANGGPAGTLPALLSRQLLDECEVEIGILCGWPQLNASGMEPSWVEFKSALMSAYNDWQIDKWLAADPRLVGSIHVNAHDPAGAVREIERLAAEPRMVQVMLYIGAYAFGGPFFHPIYEAAARHDLVLAMHQSANAKPSLGWGRYYIEWSTNIPQVFQCQLTSFIFNGVFDKIPDLRMMLIEGGFTWAPSLLWRMDSRYRQLRAEVPWVKRLPSDIVRAHVGFATQPMEELSATELEHVVDQLGSEDLLCFSTDYPHWDFDSPFGAIPKGLPEGLRRKIFSGNAKRIYPRLPQAVLGS